MAEYIDRDKTRIAMITSIGRYPTSFSNGLGIAARVVDKIPAADVVEVVRCKDCRFYERGECYHTKHEQIDVSLRYEPTDFCSYAERREGAL